MRSLPRRRALGLLAGAAVSLAARPLQALDGDAGPALASRYRDLRRHVLFEYYPWYAREPWRHWQEQGRRPPDDLASNYMPLLGAYDSRDPKVLERHARWLVDSGAGGISLSWWGRDSFEDAATPLLLDVMRDHDLKVAFHLEPHRNDRGELWADDILYLLRVHGEKRRFDALLLLEDDQGRRGPVFKGFRCILPASVKDCHGRTVTLPDHTPDSVWRRQNDELRHLLRHDFDRITLLADSVDFGRTPASGFDGVAVYDPLNVPPAVYHEHARVASRAGMLFSFNVNAGFSAIQPRRISSSDCYRALPFAPETPGLSLSTAEGRERAAAVAGERIRESLAATVAAQSDPELENARRGFFLVYVNSWNEWHEGTSFEPMRDAGALTEEERASGYANPANGAYRLAVLKDALAPILAAPDA